MGSCFEMISQICLLFSIPTAVILIQAYTLSSEITQHQLSELVFCILFNPLQYVLYSAVRAICLKCKSMSFSSRSVSLRMKSASARPTALTWLLHEPVQRHCLHSFCLPVLPYFLSVLYLANSYLTFKSQLQLGFPDSISPSNSSCVRTMLSQSLRAQRLGHNKYLISICWNW